MVIKKNIENYKAIIDNKNTFLSKTENYPTSLSDANVIISQIPYEITSKNAKSTKNACKSIMEHSSSISLFNEQYNIELDKLTIATLEPLTLNKSSKSKDNIVAISEHVADVLSYDALPIFIGGQQIITTQIIKTLLEKEKDDFAVISFSAHSNLYNSYENNVEYPYCVMRLIHQDLEVPIAQIGVRSLSKDEHDYIKINNIHVLYANQINKDNYSWVKKTLRSLPKKVYISFNFDVLDPSIMMAASRVEPNGLSYKKVLDIIETIATHSQIIGMDFVEHSPTDENRYSYIAAKLIADSIATVKSCGAVFDENSIANAIVPNPML